MLIAANVILGSILMLPLVATCVREYRTDGSLAIFALGLINIWTSRQSDSPFAIADVELATMAALIAYRLYCDDYARRVFTEHDVRYPGIAMSSATIAAIEARMPI